MMSRSRKLPQIISLIAVLTLASVVAADEQAERDFTLKVLPVLKDKCLGCHGGDPAEIKGEFSVLRREDFLRGGESGDPAIVPGAPGKGTLIEAISWEGLEMPPKENDRLNQQQIDAIRQWIQNGAVWPDEEQQQRYRDQESQTASTADGQIMPTSGGASDEWTNRRYLPEDVWAFRPSRKNRDPESPESSRRVDSTTARRGQRVPRTNG